MLKSDTFFGGKHDTPAPNSPFNTGSNLSSSGSSAIPKASNTVSTPFSQVTSSRTNEVGSKLIVGPNIKLRGVEITDCDTLVVEGRVEATMNSRVIHIAEKGAFKGSAEIDLAEIYGEFDGDLNVREKLVIYSTGKVSGKIRYGKVVIEEGGQLTGEVQVGTGIKPAAPSTAPAQTAAPAQTIAAAV
ncbi:polymer-forming cytoskeletal protein [Collimonas sp.]|jgi:cytoskeletal protein CcmA (bactofilin family)|uniref:polymer-forming cytoskeletal protein n=1 Tax=Collimonas sp. TaxID=1963772 RepID=UPI0037C09F7D